MGHYRSMMPERRASGSVVCWPYGHRRRGGPARPGDVPWVVPVAVALPLLGLGLLLARPELDLEWEHHPSHFWLVLSTAAVGAEDTSRTSRQGRYQDARLRSSRSCSCSSMGFLGLHALATPGVLLDRPNAGFSIATPVGLVLASVFAAASTNSRGSGRTDRPARTSGDPRRTHRVDGAVGRAVAARATTTRRTAAADRGCRAAHRPRRRGRRAVHASPRGAPTALSAARRTILFTTRAGDPPGRGDDRGLFVSRNWQLSWWEWHVLMLAAFVLIALGAREEYRRSGSSRASAGCTWNRRSPASTAGTPARSRRWRRRKPRGDRSIACSTNSATRVRRTRRSPCWPARPRSAGSMRRSSRTCRPWSRNGSATGRTGHRTPRRERVVSVLFADLAGFNDSEDPSADRGAGDAQRVLGRGRPSHRRGGRRDRAFRRCDGSWPSSTPRATNPITRGVPFAPRGRSSRPPDRSPPVGPATHVPGGHQHGARGAR